MINKKNLIRFDWAIKRLLRNKANYEVLEGFLSVLFKETIKIQSILESEGNQQDASDKFNRVDILVEDGKGELVIIEIQNQNEYDYFQRMIYGAAKVVSEYINLGEPFENIKKVFSVNIVYFDLGQGKDYVYHGKTEFRGVHTLDTLYLSERQKEMFGKQVPFQLFPEYYLLKVNQFDDKAKDSLDEWIYYLKNGEIREEFTAPGIQKARELLALNTLSEEERRQYTRYMEGLSLKSSLAETAKLDAIDDIKREQTIAIAKNLLKAGVATDIIVETTGLSAKEVKALDR